MRPQQDYYAKSPEALLVGLARSGDRRAFAELVRRRQDWVRNLMRRCTGDVTLADDLAQQTFVQAWRNVHRLEQPRGFGPWLKRIAINSWLQHRRRNDPLVVAGELDDAQAARNARPDVALDLDRALSTLPVPARLCIVLAYHEGMTHDEIAKWTGLPPGTVKSHIRRGSERLRRRLAAYGPRCAAGGSS